MVGSLSQLLTDLRSRQITDLNSLGEIISFRNNYDNQILQIKEKKGQEVRLEIETLKKRIIDFSTEYDIRVCEREAFSVVRRIKSACPDLY